MYAFQFCSNLAVVCLPPNVEKVGYGAFGWCSGLISVTFPSSLRILETLAFQNCTRLTDVALPNLTALGDYAFSRCFSLVNVTLSNSLLDIGTGSFDHCCELQTITFPPNLKSIGEKALFKCSSLKVISNQSKVPFSTSLVESILPNLVWLTSSGATQSKDGATALEEVKQFLPSLQYASRSCWDLFGPGPGRGKYQRTIVSSCQARFWSTTYGIMCSQSFAQRGLMRVPATMWLLGERSDMHRENGEPPQGLPLPAELIELILGFIEIRSLPQPHDVGRLVGAAANDSYVEESDEGGSVGDTSDEDERNVEESDELAFGAK
jgi:hypothetical protein